MAINQNITEKVIEISDPSALPDKPLVTVFMLTYNHASYIAQAIEGVIAQKTDFPIELVIGEDCSTDETKSVVVDYQKRYPSLIRVITGGKNVGSSNNSRRAADFFRGEYVALCEGDDYWSVSNKLDIQVEKFKNSPELAMVHTAYHYRVGDKYKFSEDHLKNANIEILCSPSATKNLMTGINWAATCTFMFRRSLFELVSLEYSDFLYRHEMGDYPLLLMASVHGGIGYLPVATGVYRKIQKSAMNSGYKARLIMQESILECRNNFIELGLSPELLGYKPKAEEFGFLMTLAYLAGDQAKMSRYASLYTESGGNIPAVKGFLRKLVVRNKLLLSAVRWRAEKSAEKALEHYKKMPRLEKVGGSISD